MKQGTSEGTLAKAENPLFATGNVAVPLPRLHLKVERIAGKTSVSERVFDGDVCRVGSHASNDIVLDDPTISRFHCRITREGTSWRIVDSGSRNGTRVSGVKVLVAEVEDGALVEVGDSLIRVTPGSLGEGASVATMASFGAIVGKSEIMLRFFAVLERIATSEIDVLVHGESGCGKELVASELVARSARADKPLVVVDCGAISPNLVESELFGHVRGAFTGADRDREGAFEAADTGTLFLDEIGEMPMELQSKMLRALEAREVRRVGQTKSRHIDVRVIAATNRDLEREVNRGRFRDDLYYRLAKVSVRVPPLRDRLEDLPLLVRSFLRQLGREDGRRLFTPHVLAEMQKYDWPGNVRELKNYVERSVVLEDVPVPTSKRSGTMMAVRSGLDDEPAPPSGEGVPFRVAKEQAIALFEKAYLGPLLERCDGNLSKAARVARMDRMYLHQLAQKYGLRDARDAKREPPDDAHR